MTLCDTCFTNLNIPTKIECGHHKCFLCIIPSNSFECNACNNNGSFELNSYTNYLWMYSSNYNGLWWCYDNNSNKKIECIYKDYLFRHEVSNNEEQFVITCDFNKKHPTRKTRTEYMTCVNDITDEFNEFNELSDDVSDFGVSFSDDNLTTQISNFTSQQLQQSHQLQQSQQSQQSPQSQQSQQSQSHELSYILKLGSIDYIIDFESMKQINTLDVWKKRSLQRIEIPNDIIKTNYKSVMDYLKTQNIIGISGKKFDFIL